MRSDYTHIVVVLDSSGSMSSIRKDTIGGFNTFLQAQKAAPGFATLTQIQFSSNIHKGVPRDKKFVPAPVNPPVQPYVPATPIGGIGTCVGLPHWAPPLWQTHLPQQGPASWEDFYGIVDNFVDIKDVKELTLETFVPYGGTPLLDSIGRAIEDTGEHLAAMKEEDRPSKVLFVIITDGEENCSVEYNYEKIEGMIKHQTDVYSWDFTYIGANQDAIKEGSKMGIRAGSSLSYAADAIGTQSTYNMLATKSVAYRAAMNKGEAIASMSYNDQERAEAMGANTTSGIC